VATANPLRVELGQRLRELREAAGKSAAAVDSDPELRWYAGKTSKIETGTRVPVATEINRLADLFDVSGSERADLQALATAARKRSPMPHVADFARSYILLEQGAKTIDYFDEVLIPAVLQTPAYARDLLSQIGDEDLEVRLTERLARRDLLDGPSAPTVRVILGEAALRRLPVDRGAAREQLEHLASVASDLPNVEIRIAPFSLGLHSVVGVGFTILTLTSPPITRVYQEGRTTATYLHEPDETDVYQSSFNLLWSRVADAAESASILRRHIHDG
jgi:transcriptional regulator with XRE-family HTH domain